MAVTLRPEHSKFVGGVHLLPDRLLGMVDLDAFTSDGYAKVEHAAPRGVADAARAVLWQQLGLSADDPDKWSAPVMWAADLTGQGQFGELARSPRLAAELDVICGSGGWQPRYVLGNIPVRFPFTAHAADEHRGQTPRFMAQAPVMLTSPLTPASSSPLARVWENR